RRLPAQAILVHRAGGAPAGADAPVLGRQGADRPADRRPEHRFPGPQGGARRPAPRPDRQGVRLAEPAGAPPGRGAVQADDRRADLGHELRQRHQRGRSRGQAPARQGGRAVFPQAAAYRARHGLCARRPACRPRRPCRMSRGLPIAWRLVAMFAATAAVVFSGVAFFLYCYLSDSVREQVRGELEVHHTLLDPVIEARRSDREWDLVRRKLDGMAQEGARIRYWIRSPDERFSYGGPFLLKEGSRMPDTPFGFVKVREPA